VFFEHPLKVISVENQGMRDTKGRKLNDRIYAFFG